ncbi:protein GLUTAMINE DUMPER 5-like [Salvia miltiorrhiza]|uniref:protein GLUTAMINE DUMPER 5-like n=1 Tax=Salvia miltiorrhiza TaxID=226208 RepID=UPI0025AC22C5|nr:protein GLUTAMINE DUMPER 5-like [Salvia miltiorrhiza]
MASAAEPAAPPSPSSWQSPVPYLFCGLAAMLGLIAFALLILGCSYWKFHGISRQRRDVEAHGGAKAAPPVFVERYLVIMAGQEKPTFLATPTSPFGSFRCGTSQTSLALEKNIQPHQSQLHQFQ